MRSLFILLVLAALLALSGCVLPKVLLGTAAIGVPIFGEAMERHAQRGVMQDFTLTLFDGTEKRLEDYRGQPIVLNFWAEW